MLPYHLGITPDQEYHEKKPRNLGNKQKNQEKAKEKEKESGRGLLMCRGFF
jgi:hypothetical protein